MHFGEVRRSGDVVLQVDDLAKAYDRPLFTDLSFSLPRGRRLGIMGPNGSGKTTLLRILLGEEEPDARHGAARPPGRVRLLRSAPEDAAAPTSRSSAPSGRSPTRTSTEQRMRDLLGRFGLVGDQVYQRVGDLSGGERSRAALARLVALGVNVLVLDEPTNHLDLWACDALEQALLEFEGTVHRRQPRPLFPQPRGRSADRAGRRRPVAGDPRQLRHLRADAGPAEAAAPRRRRKASEERPAEPAAAANDAPPTSRKRKRRFPYRKVEDLEADIAATREHACASWSSCWPRRTCTATATASRRRPRAFEETKAKLQQLYEHWEEAVELN